MLGGYTWGRTMSLNKVPEILAPAGGPAQFLAALNSGADAVFLGLKTFNARARAQNFDIADLEIYVPLAHRYGMKVLVTLNILIKENELKSLLSTLADLARVEVDGVIVQDLGLMRLLREYFPSLPIHASTQLAVHNLSGVKMAKKLGAKRVVLARELTAQEMKKIRQDLSEQPVELEAFCHGSLCYSYSGLCFFSGQDDARSGNRGECAYTCRKPYKILNEPGAGFLFSMKDLETVDDLKSFVDAGIDTLKIEGRKKDAQYVATVVKTYREKLNELASESTLRPSAPERAKTEWSDPRSLMAYSFQRDKTSLFLNGRYHENVIDLDNPTHKGQLVGAIEAVKGRRIFLKTAVDLEKYDGIRIDPKESIYHAEPQHGSTFQDPSSQLKNKYSNQTLQFSLRDLAREGQPCFQAPAQSLVELWVPEGGRLEKGDLVYKTRSASLKNKVEELSHVPDRLRKLVPIQASLHMALLGENLEVKFTAFKGGNEIFRDQLVVPAVPSNKGEDASLELQDEWRQELHIFGDQGLEITEFDFSGDFTWFVPRRRIKEFKSKLGPHLVTALADWESSLIHGVAWNSSISLADVAVKENQQRLTVKIDRMSYLEPIQQAFESLKSKNLLIPHEISFEPKRAFLGKISPEELFGDLTRWTETMGVSLRVALPTVIRAWDEPLLKRWLKVAYDLGVRRFQVGNIGAMLFLTDLGFKDIDLASDFTLYALNQFATKELKSLSVGRYALSLENDKESLESQLKTSQISGIEPELILYKDTPLFIAESCSLTALHGGCPTAKVCGYRTLDIVNDEGEEFQVIHESCKSVVIGKNAFSISEERPWAANCGIKYVRADFLSRSYSPDEIDSVLKSIGDSASIKSTHPGNHFRTLL